MEVDEDACVGWDPREKLLSGFCAKAKVCLGRIGWGDTAKVVVGAWAGEGTFEGEEEAVCSGFGVLGFEVWVGLALGAAAGLAVEVWFEAAAGGAVCGACADAARVCALAAGAKVPKVLAMAE